MKKETFKFKDNGAQEIFVYKFLPESTNEVKGVLQIAHGMAETAQRYERFAKFLTNEGYIVYANDHRGHGKTVGDIEKLGDLGEDGFNMMVNNMHQLTEIIKEENKGLPVFLLGHSMGSFLTQRYICLHGSEINGAILSGSCGRRGAILNIGRLIAKREIKARGRSGKSQRLNDMSFKQYNNSFKPTETEFDWLSRDKDEVQKYIDDPYCGTVFTAGFFYDFFEGLKTIEKSEEINKIPKDLPIYIFSGDKDPVGLQGKGVTKLYNTYKKNNISDVTCKLYKDGRHEMLNETNREEVMKDVLNWLEKHIA